MDDTKRFCDGDDEALRRLMLAMRDERPPDGAAHRALSALGVGSAAMLATSSALGAGSGGSAVGKSLAGLAFKWLGAGAAIGLVAATGAGVLPPAADDPVPAPAAASAPKAAPAARVERAPGERPRPATVEAEVLARPPRATPRALGAIEPPPAPAPPEAQSVARFESAPPADSQLRQDSLVREIELLDQARSALRAGAPDAALAKLDRFAHEFPRGRLATEAFVVRLEALVRANRITEARTLAGTHLTRNPSSPHAARIRRIVGLEAP